VLGRHDVRRLGNTDHEECHRIIQRALDAGINFIDTADVYSAGDQKKSWRFPWLDRSATPRHRLGHESPRPDGRRPQPPRQFAALDNLRVRGQPAPTAHDYIDLYQVHRPSPGTDIDDTLAALSDWYTPARSGISAVRRSRPGWWSRRIGPPNGDLASACPPSSPRTPCWSAA